MVKNRFKNSGPTINFDDPSVLTAVPAAIDEEVVAPDPVSVEPVCEERPVKVDPANILAGKLQKKPESKSYSFYLDVDVAVALDKLAKQNKLSKSQALNTLLRDLLIES